MRSARPRRPRAARFWALRLLLAYLLAPFERPFERVELLYASARQLAYALAKAQAGRSRRR